MTELDILNKLKAELTPNQLKAIDARQINSKFYWKGRDKFFICKKCKKETQVAFRYYGTTKYNNYICGTCNRKKYKKRNKEKHKRINIKDYAERIDSLYAQGFSRNAIATILGISHTPVYKYIKNREANNEQEHTTRKT